MKKQSMDYRVLLKLNAKLKANPPQCKFYDCANTYCAFDNKLQTFRSYRWSKDSRKLNLDDYGGRIIQKVGSGTLRINDPKSEDTGIYVCFAENEHGVASSNPVHFRKSIFPKTTDEIVQVEAKEGEPYGIKCDVSPDIRPKPELSWVIITNSGGIKTIQNPRLIE